MDCYLLTSNSAFEKLLNEQEPDVICYLGWKHISWEAMFLTLNYWDTDLANFLCEEFTDFNPEIHLLDANGLSLQVARYLYAMQKEDLRDLYHAFMETAAVAEDLLTLTRSERITVVAELWHWSINDVRRVDLISAN